MKKIYFLGAAANYTRKERLAHTFAIGTKRSCEDLIDLLEKKYSGKAMLTKNGRSALALALRANLEKGSRIIINGFTCYAVYEAVKAAEMEPVFADISKENLNFTIDTIKNLKADGIIIQNTLGNVVDIEAIEKWAEENNVKIIEDLAHCTGKKYADGREVGTVGVATALSFGKEKSIDTISGGAVIFRDKKPKIAAPRLKPRRADALRERFYPMFGAMYRGLTHIHMGGALMRFLLAIHFVQKSADNKLEMNRKISKFEAKRALAQLGKIEDKGLIRDFYLVHDRDKLLKELEEAGYHFSNFWYEKPVSPERYYEKVNFPEDKCPVAVEVASKIINVPKYYNEEQLAPALKIIKKYTEGA